MIDCAVSIPFSSGQRMQLSGWRGIGWLVLRRFNPLFIGSKDATPPPRPRRGGVPPFQSPFHRVKGCNLAIFLIPLAAYLMFQSPFHRVKGCNHRRIRLRILFSTLFQSPFHRVKGCNISPRNHAVMYSPGFNPLFIGSKDATLEKRPERQAHRRVSIPFSSGQRMQPWPATTRSTRF